MGSYCATGVWAKSLSIWSVIGAMVVAGCAPASAPTGAPSVATPQPTTAPAAQVAPTVNPASVTGTITVYGALTEANGQAIARLFQAKYPNATVEMVTSGTGALVTRIETERRAGGVRADVILLADPTAMNQLRDNNVLSDYVPAAAANFPAGLRGNGWVGAFTFNNVIIVRQGGPTIQDWNDLTRPELRDRVMIADPAFSGTTLGMVGHLSNQLGWDYFRTLQRNGARTTQSTNTIGTEVAQGSVIAGITLDSVARDLVQRGSPVQVIWPSSGAVPVPAPVGLVRGRGESIAGRAFVDWLVSAEGQQELEKLGYVPVVGQTAAVPANARISQVDWTRISREREQILETFRSIFG